MSTEKFNETKYKNDYNKTKYDSLRIVTTKGNKDILKKYCEDKNTSLNALVNTLLKERLEADGYKLIDKADMPSNDNK